MTRSEGIAAQLNQVHCIDAFDLLRLLPDHSVDMVLTDPPYNILRFAWDAPVDYPALMAELLRVCKPSGAVVITSKMPFAVDLINAARDYFRYEWVWHKTMPTGFLNSNRRPLQVHENVLIFSRGSLMVYNPQMKQGKAYNKKRNRKTHYSGYNGHERQSKEYPSDERYPTDVITLSNHNHNSPHPTAKPVPLFEYLIRTYTQPGDLVLDPFCGSGTTALAARACGRNFICGDFTQEYVDIARDRLRLPFEPRHVKQETRLDDLPLFKELTE